MPETQSDDAVIRASIKMNTLLLLGKVVASVITTRTSPVIVATLVDSAIDVLIQVAKPADGHDRLYPISMGRYGPVVAVRCMKSGAPQRTMAMTPLRMTTPL